MPGVNVASDRYSLSHIHPFEGLPIWVLQDLGLSRSVKGGRQERMPLAVPWALPGYLMERHEDGRYHPYVTTKIQAPDWSKSNLVY